MASSYTIVAAGAPGKRVRRSGMPDIATLHSYELMALDVGPGVPRHVAPLTASRDRAAANGPVFIEAAAGGR